MSITTILKATAKPRLSVKAQTIAAIAGLLGPLASFAISHMPGEVMLPFMMIELCAYELFAGMLKSGEYTCVLCSGGRNDHLHKTRCKAAA